MGNLLAVWTEINFSSWGKIKEEKEEVATVFKVEVKYLHKKMHSLYSDIVRSANVCVKTEFN